MPLHRFRWLVAMLLLGGCGTRDTEPRPDSGGRPLQRRATEAGPSRPPQPGGAAQVAWPATNLPEFVFTHLDLTTFGNSTGPRREAGQRFLSDLGIHPSALSSTSAIHESGDWLFAVRVLGRGDFNGDRVEDVAICFTDRALNGGTYYRRHPLLLRLQGGRVVASKLDLPDPELCPPAEY